MSFSSFALNTWSITGLEFTKTTSFSISSTLSLSSFLTNSIVEEAGDIRHLNSVAEREELFIDMLEYVATARV